MLYTNSREWRGVNVGHGNGDLVQLFRPMLFVPGNYKLQWQSFVTHSTFVKRWIKFDQHNLKITCQWLISEQTINERITRSDWSCNQCSATVTYASCVQGLYTSRWHARLSMLGYKERVLLNSVVAAVCAFVPTIGTVVVQYEMRAGRWDAWGQVVC